MADPATTHSNMDPPSKVEEECSSLLDETYFKLDRGDKHSWVGSYRICMKTRSTCRPSNLAASLGLIVLVGVLKKENLS